ncbi:cellulose biosynthesis protein BcsG [Chromobacterium alticapitis]|uniref:Cellulose biosynthesis protein BcsG n=1 Tax=Chromobacterium alticapitis TaxID=2073169 RepID=A0A2S5DBX8_9NEIS|nr:cellulose biosynthesis protein BcsG [Chromobacterium alticapitis]POZ60538.1 cellulose biosynthesis protein BcsG [Chromobacterium alticapitis]
MSATSSPSARRPPAPVGMGGWSFYFIVKLAMDWQGALNLHPLPNLAFALLLLLPVPRGWPRFMRAALAWPAAIALLYRDSWLPPPDKLLPQLAALRGFTLSYWMELAGRVLTPSLLTSAVILVCGYLLLSRHLRLGTLVMAALLALGGRQLWQERAVPVPVAAVAGSGQTAAQTPEEQLAAFYRGEKQRRVQFQPLPAGPGFDVLLLHICSLSWDDLEAVGLEHHPLFSRFDMLFTHFNSAATYSGPAALRVLRASCGQPTHAALYDPAPDNCYLFSNLAQLGFKVEATFNHDGSFDGFLKQVRSYGHLDKPLIDQQGLPVNLRAFDSSPIYSDYATLDRWLQLRQRDDSPHVATYYNTISLHDGNRIPAKPGLSTNDSYQYRANRLFNDIDRFIDQLEQSHRKLILLVVPEHGAALRGDKQQFGGLREIPTPRITLLPAAIKVIGGDNHAHQVRIDQPISYYAVTTILSRMLSKSPFGPDYQPDAYAQDLPGTSYVAESSGYVMMQSGTRYLLRQSDGSWNEYQP